MLQLQKKYIINVKMLKKEKNPDKQRQILKELENIDKEIQEKMKT